MRVTAYHNIIIMVDYDSYYTVIEVHYQINTFGNDYYYYRA